MADDNLLISIDADTTGFETALKTLEKQASSFGDTVAGSLKSAIRSGKSFEDTLRSIGLSLANSAFDAGFKPLKGILNNFGSNLFSSFTNVKPFADGGVPGGGIIASPTYFPNGNSIGLMGEAGKEAILPLQRASDGSLGVATTGGASAPNVTINISTPDVTGFQRSSAQISAALTRAVVRGQRGN